MKKKDLTLIAVVVVVSAALSILLSNAVIGDSESEPLSAEVVQPISAEFNPPSEKYFNKNSVNPTQLIRIGDEEGNRSPFGQLN